MISTSVPAIIFNFSRCETEASWALATLGRKMAALWLAAPSRFLLQSDENYLPYVPASHLHTRPPLWSECAWLSCTELRDERGSVTQSLVTSFCTDLWDTYVGLHSDLSHKQYFRHCHTGVCFVFVFFETAMRLT